MRTRRRVTHLPRWVNDPNKVSAFVSACLDNADNKSVCRVIGISPTSIGSQMTKLRTALTRKDGSDGAFAPHVRPLAAKLVALYDGRQLAASNRGFNPTGERVNEIMQAIDDQTLAEEKPAHDEIATSIAGRSDPYVQEESR